MSGLVQAEAEQPLHQPLLPAEWRRGRSTLRLLGTTGAGGMLWAQHPALGAVSLALSSVLLPVSPPDPSACSQPHGTLFPAVAHRQAACLPNPWVWGVPAGLARLHCLCRLLQPGHATVVAGEPAALPCPRALRWPLDRKSVLVPSRVTPCRQLGSHPVCVRAGPSVPQMQLFQVYPQIPKTFSLKMLHDFLCLGHE